MKLKRKIIKEAFINLYERLYDRAKLKKAVSQRKTAFLCSIIKKSVLLRAIGAIV
jgi:hypothetical protein